MAFHRLNIWGLVTHIHSHTLTHTHTHTHTHMWTGPSKLQILMACRTFCTQTLPKNYWWWFCFHRLWTLKNMFLWNLNWNTNIFFQEMHLTMSSAKRLPFYPNYSLLRSKRISIDLWQLIIRKEDVGMSSKCKHIDESGTRGSLWCVYF